ncbi:MAG: chromosome partitioning protein ParB, partial [Pseudomonadota bacterium]
MSVKKRGLGRGLDALLGTTTTPLPEQSASTAPSTDSALRERPVDLIQRGKYQPRRDIDPERLQELAD